MGNLLYKDINGAICGRYDVSSFEFKNNTLRMWISREEKLNKNTTKYNEYGDYKPIFYTETELIHSSITVSDITSIFVDGVEIFSPVVVDRTEGGNENE